MHGEMENGGRISFFQIIEPEKASIHRASGVEAARNERKKKEMSDEKISPVRRAVRRETGGFRTMRPAQFVPLDFPKYLRRLRTTT